jgi:hypothetical protein
MYTNVAINYCIKKLTNGYVIFYMIELTLPVNINNNI